MPQPTLTLRPPLSPAAADDNAVLLPAGILTGRLPSEG